jgi:hypothetical protein
MSTSSSGTTFRAATVHDYASAWRRRHGRRPTSLPGSGSSGPAVSALGGAACPGYEEATADRLQFALRRGSGWSAPPLPHPQCTSVARGAQTPGLDGEEAVRFLAAAQVAGWSREADADLLHLGRMSEVAVWHRVHLPDLGVARRYGARPNPRRRGRLRVRGRLGEGRRAGPCRRARPARLPDAGGGRAAGTRPWGGPLPVQQPPPPAGPAAGGTRSGCGVGDGHLAHSVILG